MTEKQDENNKKKGTSNKGKFIALAVMGVVLVVAAVLLIVLSVQGNEAKAIMQMSTNPSVQVVLNGNDKVIAEVALNEDGEQLLANVSFMGLSADVAAAKFAEVSAEMGKINSGDASNTNGAVTVNISISAENAEDYKNLAQKAEDAVNKYFSENGVFAGAVASVSADIKTALTTMGANAQDFADKTTEELLDYAKTTADDLKSVAYELRDDLTTKFETLYNTVLKIADEAMQTAKEALDNAPAEVKDTLQQAYDEALKAYNEAKATFDQQYEEFFKSIQEQSKSILEQIKTSAEQAYETSSAAFEEAVNAFKQKSEADREALQQQIADFQESLKTA